MIVLVKGNRAEAERAAESRGIPTTFMHELFEGRETMLKVDDIGYGPEVVDWFAEDPSGPGTCLWYRWRQ